MKGVNSYFQLHLHVGLERFRPVSMDSLEDHKMHSDIMMSKGNCGYGEATKKAGKRVIAVGTTLIRTLETVARDN